MRANANFDGLTTKEISALYEKTKQAVRKQRGIEQAQGQAPSPESIVRLSMVIREGFRSSEDETVISARTTGREQV